MEVWSPLCLKAQIFSCDESNWWDLHYASHGQTMALMETGGFQLLQLNWCSETCETCETSFFFSFTLPEGPYYSEDSSRYGYGGGMGFGCWASGSASALRAEIRTRLALERRVKAFMREHHMVFGGFLQQSSREGSGAIALPSCGWGSCKFCFPCGVCRRFPFEHALIFFRRFFQTFGSEWLRSPSPQVFPRSTAGTAGAAADYFDYNKRSEVSVVTWKSYGSSVESG